MNIFILDIEPEIAARLHCDKHVVKMVLEYAQLLCTAHRELDPGRTFPEDFYKSTHKNHPCAVWTRESVSNYRWLYRLFTCLCKEYTHRYGRVHLCETKLQLFLSSVPMNIPLGDLTPFVSCMDKQYIVDSPLMSHFNVQHTIANYRNYYKLGKKDLLKYTKRDTPIWVLE